LLKEKKKRKITDDIPSQRLQVLPQPFSDSLAQFSTEDAQNARTHARHRPLVAVVAFVFYTRPTGTQERYSSTWFGHVHPHNVRFIHFQHAPSLQMLCNLSHPKVPSVFSLFLQISEYPSCAQDVTLQTYFSHPSLGIYFLNQHHPQKDKRTKGLQIDGGLIVAKHLN